MKTKTTNVKASKTTKPASEVKASAKAKKAAADLNAALSDLVGAPVTVTKPAKDAKTKSKKAIKAIVENIAAQAVEQLNEAAAKLEASSGPNEKFPFGLKLTDEKGNVSWERFKTDAQRKKRASSLNGTPGGMDAVDHYDGKTTTVTPAPVKRVPVAEVIAESNAKHGDASKKLEAKKAAKTAKGDKRRASSDALNITLNKRGRLYFGAQAATRIAGMEHFAITVSGSTMTVEASAKATKSTQPIRRSHGRPVVRVTKLLKEMGWTGEGAVIEASPLNGHGFKLALAKVVK